MLFISTQLLAFDIALPNFPNKDRLLLEILLKNALNVFVGLLSIKNSLSLVLVCRILLDTEYRVFL